MGILWLIIKIILLVLLTLLVLIIVGLFIVLMSPISYEAYLEKYDELIYDIKFTYLGAVHGRFCQERNYKKHEIRAFGKILYEGEVEEENESQSPANAEVHEKKAYDEKIRNKPRPMKQQEDVREKTEAKRTKGKEKVKAEEIDTPVMESIQETSEEATHKAVNETKAFVRHLEGGQIKELLLRKDFWRLIKEIWHALKSIVRYVLPRDWSYEVIIGGEDPAQTGEMLAKIIMLYPLYYKHGIIKGDFEKRGVRGGFLAKGRFNIFGILMRIVAFLCRPVVREYIKLIFKIRKEEKDGK